MEFFSLQELVQETLDIFAVRAQEKGIQLKLIHSKDLESAIVLADPNRLRQVLLNLVGNAVKFTDRGSVTVQVSCRQNQGSQRRFRFEITDTGKVLHQVCGTGRCIYALLSLKRTAWQESAEHCRLQNRLHGQRNVMPRRTNAFGPVNLVA